MPAKQQRLTWPAGRSRPRGYRVLGTSISGQAARTLGTEAGIEESRTIASLLWRLDHGQLYFDDRTVVICDEAGMTDDPAMLRLLAATEAASSKLVIIGDHRQIGAVGPGGSLEALVSRRTATGCTCLRERPPGQPRRARRPR